MRTPIFQLDAFTTRRFAGNPAAVMPMAGFLGEGTMQAVAAENNLPATAFLVHQSGDYSLRWFSPTSEIPLCGHATLASGAVVMERLEPGRREVAFHTAGGLLAVHRTDTGYVMDFPTRPAVPIQVPPGLEKALGVAPIEILANDFNYLTLLENAQAVRDLNPDLTALVRLDRRGMSVTAAGDGTHDFISRYFAPAMGIPEDSVTGSAHCMLAPFWAERLNQTEFRAFQASRRGGEIVCRVIGDRVELEGGCVFYLEGEVEI